MKVQLISDSAVHTSRTKAQLFSQERGWQQFSNSLRLRKFSCSLKDTLADNGFIDWLTWVGIKEGTLCLTWLAASLFSSFTRVWASRQLTTNCVFYSGDILEMQVNSTVEYTMLSNALPSSSSGVEYFSFCIAAENKHNKLNSAKLNNTKQCFVLFSLQFCSFHLLAQGSVDVLHDST